MLRDHAVAVALLVALWACCVLLPGSVRRASIDGLRCLGRYADLWRIPANFAVGYALFQLAAASLLHLRMQDLSTWLLETAPQPLPTPETLLAMSVPASIERTASIFTIFTATFPLSAFFALLLLGNFRGLLVGMLRAFRRRLGLPAALALSALLVLSALCALVRPALYLLLPELEAHLPLAAMLGIDVVAFVFELLLGIFFLTYLMLMAHAWMRGLHFERSKLFHVAMRRTAHVLKWSLPLTVLAALLVVAPASAALIAENELAAQTTWFSSHVGIPLVVATALIFCPAQAVLVFRNESLHGALRESCRLVRSHWRGILPFLVGAAVLFLLLSAISSAATIRLGAETAAALVVAVPLAGVEAFAIGWLIASWVGLYKNLSSGRREVLL